MDTSVWRVLPDAGPLVAPAGSVTSVAVLAGLPAVSVPVTTADGLPAGLSLVGPAGSDRALLRRAADLGGAGTLRPAPGPRGTRR